MSKSKKGKKKGRRRPKLSPLTMLRPRLDDLWGNPDWADQEKSTQQADLTGLTEGIEPSDFLPVLARAYSAAPAIVQKSLDHILPDWLQIQGFVDDLQIELERHALAPEDAQTALGWLQAMGIDTSEMETESSTFYRAFAGEDDFGSQGLLALFWYSTYRRDRIKGLSLLIDFNPPWEGAAKDVLDLPQGSPRNATESFLDLWRTQGLELRSLDPIEAKKSVLETFAINRREGIRLHRDIAALRDEFVRHVFTLPDGPESPLFTIEDFDELTRQGNSTESIMISEQTQGRRVRLEDGTEIVMLSPDDGFFLEDE